VENSVNKDGMETWDNQQSAVQTGGEATPADTNPGIRKHNFLKTHVAGEVYYRSLEAFAVVLLARG
jgi:hypothetical protein